MSRSCDVSRAADHVMKYPRPSPSVFAYCKRSKTGGVEGLETRLDCDPVYGGCSCGMGVAYHIAPYSTEESHSQSTGSFWMVTDHKPVDKYCLVRN